jgi:hypothetical protein
MIFNLLTKFYVLSTFYTVLFLNPTLGLIGLPLSLYEFTNSNWKAVEKELNKKNFVFNNDGKNHYLYDHFNCSKFEKIIFEHKYENNFIFNTFIFSLVFICIIILRRHIILIILFFIIFQFFWILSRYKKERLLNLKILRCKLFKECHLNYIPDDKKYILFLKGLIFLQPQKYFSEINGFLIEDKTCIKLYKNIVNIYQDRPNIIYIVKKFFI